MPHLFLTGQKHIGKTTLLKALLKEHSGFLGGFYTCRVNHVVPGEESVHMLPAGKAEAPSGENLLFLCRQKQDARVAGNFNRLGHKLLSPLLSANSLPPNTVLLMDELGAAEAGAQGFIRMVEELLSRRCPPVLGVLQEGAVCWQKALLLNRRVQLVPVTEDNRDGLLPQLARLFYRFDAIPSFGAIVLEKGPAEPLVLMVGGYHGWSFPKGHADIGEPPQHTAQREVWEETRIPITVDTRFAHTVKSARPEDKNTVTFFLGKSLVGTAPPKAQREEVETAAWMPVSRAKSLIGYAPDKAALEAALAFYSP